MKEGQVLMYDQTKNVIGKYLQENSASIDSHNDITSVKRDFEKYGKRAIIASVALEKLNFYWKEHPKFSFTVKIKDKNITNYAIGFAINAANGTRLFTYNSDSVGKIFTCQENDTITYTFNLKEPSLVPSRYYISIGIRSNLDTLDALDNCFTFNVLEMDSHGTHFGFSSGPEVSGYIDNVVDVTEMKTK
jgi:hypothetical protein